MTFALDPELEAALLPVLSGSAGLTDVLGDWQSIRDAVGGGRGTDGPPVEEYLGVTRTEFSTTSEDGAEVSLSWFVPEVRDTEAAVVYAHGGGMVAGSVALSAPLVSQYVAQSGVPFLSVEYRLAPEGQGTDLAEDVFAGMLWLIGRAAELGVDTQRIGVFGESAGAGIVAGAAILARDRGLSVAQQVLVYPMLDDRTVVADPELEDFALWSYINNETGWSALLGTSRGSETVSPVAAPARLVDFVGLPQTYIEVGALDIFRDEDIRFAMNLLAAGVPTELHVHPGLSHGYDQFAPAAEVTTRVMADRVRVLRGF